MVDGVRQEEALKLAMQNREEVNAEVVMEERQKAEDKWTRLDQIKDELERKR